MGKQSKKFARLVRDYLDTVNECSEFDSTNVIKEKHLSYEYVADTVYGSRLLVKVDECRGFYTVFTRFEEPNKVKDLPTMNRYSGKNNYHVMLEDPEHAANYVIGQLADMIEFNEREKSLT